MSQFFCLHSGFSLSKGFFFSVAVSFHALLKCKYSFFSHRVGVLSISDVGGSSRGAEGRWLKEDAFPCDQFSCLMISFVYAAIDLPSATFDAGCRNLSTTVLLYNDPPLVAFCHET